MARTPGLIVPSAYSSQQDLEADLKRRDAAAGFTPFDPAEFVDDALEHFGVKGMKWGVHNGEVGAGASRGERKAAGKESKLAYKAWKQEVGGEKVANEIFQDATKSFGKAVKVINDLPEFKGKDLTTDARTRRLYDRTVSDVFNQHLATASIERTTTNTGRAMIYQFDSTVGMMRATESQLVIHADEEPYPDFIAEMDSLGHIISLRLAGDEAMAQSSGFVGDFLKHYGVKGMKWGQVRSRSQIDAGDSFDVVAVKEAKQKISAGRSTDALSNKELQTVVTRMNLESQYKRLVSEDKGSMNPLVKKQLDAGKAAVISLGVKHAEDKITDFIANKNPAAGIVLKTLLEAKRRNEQQGKKNK